MCVCRKRLTANRQATRIGKKIWYLAVVSTVISTMHKKQQQWDEMPALYLAWPSQCSRGSRVDVTTQLAECGAVSFKTLCSSQLPFSCPTHYNLFYPDACFIRTIVYQTPQAQMRVATTRVVRDSVSFQIPLSLSEFLSHELLQDPSIGAASVLWCRCSNRWRDPAMGGAGAVIQSGMRANGGEEEYTDAATVAPAPVRSSTGCCG